MDLEPEERQPAAQAGQAEADAPEGGREPDGRLEEQLAERLVAKSSLGARAAARVATVVGALLVVGAAYYTGLFSLLGDPPRLKAALLGLGPAGYFAYLGGFGVLQPLGVPGIALVIGASLVWPPPIAFALCMTGSMLSSVVGFTLARFVARDWVRERIPPRFARYEATLARRAFATIFVLRLVFLMNPFLHGLFGLSQVRFSTHLVASALGYVPTLLAISWLGGSIVELLTSQPKERFVLVAAVVVTGALVALALRRRSLRRALERAAREHPEASAAE